MLKIRQDAVVAFWKYSLEYFRIGKQDKIVSPKYLILGGGTREKSYIHNPLIKPELKLILWHIEKVWAKILTLLLYF